MNKEVATDLAMALFEIPGVKSISYRLTGEVVVNKVEMAVKDIVETRGSLYYWREIEAIVAQIKGVLGL